MELRQFPDARVLIIDDEPDKVKLISQLLHLDGLWNFRTETNPAKSIAVFKEFAPDLVILDLHMRPFDGFYVLSKIMPMVPNNTYVPVLMITGDITRDAKERALASGAMDFLSKPFNAAEIRLRVKNLLHTRMLHLQLHEERNKLEEAVKERTLDILHGQSEMLDRLALVSEYRDDTTGGHMRRVGEIVQMLALSLGLDPQESELIGQAALLHDIGKIAIPDAVLLKAGRLDEDEFATIRTHADIGGDLLKDSRSSLLRIAERIARYHHERWDGTGYVGLSGEDIPLEARITAVADVYDALRMARPYKDPWTHEMAVAEIKRLSGTYFGPNIIEAFLRIEMNLKSRYHDVDQGWAA